MTAKGVSCKDCRFCDVKQGWCRVKALVVVVRSVRNCKVFSKNIVKDVVDKTE